MLNWTIIISSSLSIIHAMDLSVNSCYNDTSCAYYCDNINKICQLQIPLGQKCSGYHIHQRECGNTAWCDSQQNYTCQPLKSGGKRCISNHECVTKVCNMLEGKCKIINHSSSSSDNMSDNIIILGIFLGFCFYIVCCYACCTPRQNTIVIRRGDGTLQCYPALPNETIVAIHPDTLNFTQELSEDEQHQVNDDDAITEILPPPFTPPPRYSLPPPYTP
ncbi:unnamed protein product [Didymodactylos carnosus]|uniref:Uncharacterized protein n=1 Tax=Didymodactylos carnosus TaxID=1234261 RepID=A0A814NEY8_9BILA|nr:unnamed protein product [Didymodactylos carnosus]CAF1090544.1 unnamed protein product [Didymodactylos carnosus]CAF3754645.1 unnamed protein product [Didymodactylos carnosus]CAF3856045.1 unnamed protein product [Didymodactylos carnosus]